MVGPVFHSRGHCAREPWQRVWISSTPSASRKSAASSKRFQRLEKTALRESYCLVVDGVGWHRGVIGIVATRVVGVTTGRRWSSRAREKKRNGSGRSIHGFHLLDALESCRELFTRYGGHAYAVGCAAGGASCRTTRRGWLCPGAADRKTTSCQCSNTTTN